MVEEVALRVGVVERRRDLDVVRPDRGRGLHESDQLQRARRLAADRDRYATGGRRDDSLPDRHALIERHRREVARRPAREEDRGARHAPAVDEELHVPRDRIDVQGEFRIVAEHRRDRDVAAGQAISGPRRIHRLGLRAPVDSLCITASSATVSGVDEGCSITRPECPRSDIAVSRRQRSPGTRPGANPRRREARVSSR